MSVVQSESSPWDRLGALASGLCAIHCATCALLPSAVAALGLGTLLGHEAEWAFTLVAIGLAVVAMAQGYRKHRSRKVAGALGGGAVALLIARFAEEAGGGHEVGTALGIAAAVVLIVGHVWNIRATRCCEQECVGDAFGATKPR